MVKRASTPWSTADPDHVRDAKKRLQVWPLDEYNAHLLDEVHPRDYYSSSKAVSDEAVPPVYDLVAIGAGAGGLVSSRQSARRGAKSALISAHLAGGDCLNVGWCVLTFVLRAEAARRRVIR